MTAFRCTGCGACWPKEADYRTCCPECEADTYVSHGNEPMPAEEAHSRMTHARFEHWLDEHGRRDSAEVLEAIPVKDKPTDA